MDLQNVNPELVALSLLGEPNKKLSSGSSWRYGRNGSLAVDVAKGIFSNFETGENGGILELIRSRGIESPIQFLEGLGEIEKPIQAKPDTPAPPPKTMAYAKTIWNQSQEPDAFVACHPYAQRKGITWAAGARRGNASGRLIGRGADCIVVPAKSVTGDLQAIQCIDPEGKKQSFGCIKNSFLLVGNTLDKSLPWYVCEGWASAVSLVFHHCKGNAVCAVSFGSHNLENVAQLIADHYQPDEVVIIREVDA